MCISKNDTDTFNLNYVFLITFSTVSSILCLSISLFDYFFLELFWKLSWEICLSFFLWLTMVLVAAGHSDTTSNNLAGDALKYTEVCSNKHRYQHNHNIEDLF